MSTKARNTHKSENNFRKQKKTHEKQNISNLVHTYFPTNSL